ncbi:MAG: TRAP transporter large permease, partial [Firmicutes bacterium]|nr:TRAP transporter large permease [Bacillota bacterium]
MVDQGYDKGFVASLLAASGTLGLVIPPSVCMVVYSQNASCSIGRMFLAGFIPGILAELLLAILSVYIAKRRKYKKVDVGVTSAKDALKITLDAFLPLLMPVIILGGTMSGICTATESAAIATVYAFVLAKFVYREMTWKNFYETLIGSSKTSASILFIIAASTPFGWVLTLENFTTKVSNAVFSTLSSPALIYAAVVLILVILGTFMESFTIIILTTPIFLPIVTQLGVDPIAYGLVLMFCICIGGVTPPLAVCLFTSSKIVKIRIEDSIPDVFMVLGILLFVTILLMIFPQLSLFLPSLMMK